METAADSEANSAAQMIDEAITTEASVLTDMARTELLTGRTALRNVQIAVYVSQLVNLDRESES